MAAIGVILTIENNQNLKNKELLNDLDQKSEWRKELMNIAAKPVIQLEDVYRILASLRFLPKSKDEIEESDQPKFDEISNYIYKRLNEILNDTFKIGRTEDKLVVDDEEIKMNINENEEIRLYTKFLLKHHWEYNQSEKDRNDFKEKEMTEFLKVIDQVRNLNSKNIIKSNDFYQIEGYENIDKLYKEWEEKNKTEENNTKENSTKEKNRNIIYRNLSRILKYKYTLALLITMSVIYYLLLNNFYNFLIISIIVSLIIFILKRKKIMYEIYTFTNNSRRNINMGNNEYSNSFIKFLLYFMFILIPILYIVGGVVSSKLLKILGDGIIAGLSILFITLIEPIYENYIISKKSQMKKEDLENFDNQYKEDLRTIKITGGLCILFLSVVIITFNFFNEAEKESNYLNTDKTNFNYKKDKNGKTEIDTENSEIQLKNGKKYKVQEVK
ncbi:hypothetical protein [Staphylococcus hominis]|nr:hypothetical protein [Staphylococcus hominis]MCI2840441.1 hypothetical protein [Staphylococcus hominis]MCI2879069.1 hypothetical protein [Staphylococcus hominis]MDS3832387.1 hypothetical protein [Staphylococcus hominis]